MAEIRWINKNKSCIEITGEKYLYLNDVLINKNKSCIEIYYSSFMIHFKI